LAAKTEKKIAKLYEQIDFKSHYWQLKPSLHLLYIATLSAFKSHYWQLKLKRDNKNALLPFDFKSHYWQLKPKFADAPSGLTLTLNPTIGS